MSESITIFLKMLDPLGKFLANNGLAILLVIWFVFSIYPEEQKMRQEWILRLERLERSIDPEHRPLNNAQIIALSNYTFNYFVESIKTSLNDIDIKNVRSTHAYIIQATTDNNNKTTIYLGDETLPVKSVLSSGDLIVKSYCSFQKKISNKIYEDYKKAFLDAVKLTEPKVEGLVVFTTDKGNLRDLHLQILKSLTNDMADEVINSYKINFLHTNRDSLRTSLSSITDEKNYLIDLENRIDKNCPIPEPINPENKIFNYFEIDIRNSIKKILSN